VEAVVDHSSGEAAIGVGFAEVEPSQCPPAFAAVHGTYWRPRCLLWFGCLKAKPVPPIFSSQ